MTVKDLLGRLDSDELSEWFAYYKLAEEESKKDEQGNEQSFSGRQGAAMAKSMFGNKR